jgi:hypothetical protein
MPVYDLREHSVQRDMDLVRDILLRIEQDPKYDGTAEFYYETPEDFGIDGQTIDEVSYHLALLIQEGFIDGAVTSVVPMQIIRKLTWRGHEFLDNIRDPDIWDKTKLRILGLKSVALSLVVEVAKAEVKKRLGLP